MMQLVNNSDLLTSIFKKYKRSECFFPLIGAVLESKQEGMVYVDHPDDPNTMLIIHKFMFAQVLCDEPTDDTWENICKIIAHSRPKIDKIRFYCADESFIKYLEHKKEFKFQIGERARFAFDIKNNVALEDHCELLPEDTEHLNEKLHLDVANRFWSGKNDFLNNSFAFCIKEDGIIKSVCYAAAVSNKYAEIDIATHPDYQKMGYAKKSTTGFIVNCQNNRIIPLWDCYKDNIASMKTARSLGFNELYNYKFLIITNNK